MNAVMIMCHKNIEQVMRLIRLCSSPETRIILHIDSKYALNAQQLADLEQMEDVFLTDERFSGVLDTRSLVDIAMCMVQKAKDVENLQGIHFDYYMLLSGQDYLIKPISYINDALRQAYPEPLIDCTPHAKGNWVFYKFRFAPSVYAMSNWMEAYRSPLCKPVLLCARILRKLLYTALSLLHMTDYDRFTQQGVSLYGGSAWWILPDVVIDYICSEFETNRPFVDRLLNTLTPEETFFQIMSMRSPLKDRIHINPPDMVAQHCKTWAYFSDVDKPFMGHPYIFTVNEYDRLMSSDFWIARKFDSNVDSEILDMLDSALSS